MILIIKFKSVLSYYHFNKGNFIILWRSTTLLISKELSLLNYFFIISFIAQNLIN